MKMSGTQVVLPEEILRLARRAVENGLEETKLSLGNSDSMDDSVLPKLTINLGHSNIGSIPEPMIDLIKDEVAR